MVSEFELDENWKIKNVNIQNGKTIKTDFVILSIGIKPNTDLLIKNCAKHIKNGALIVNEHMELFNSVTDTLSKSNHLVVLTHKLIWLDKNPALASYLNSLPNGGPGTCHYCLNPNNFYADLYPKLKEVKERGVNVICIAGDVGKKALEFEYLTPEGIHFLASGMNGDHPGNTVLLFEQDSVSLNLSWNFVDIKTLKRK